MQPSSYIYLAIKAVRKRVETSASVAMLNALPTAEKHLLGGEGAIRQNLDETKNTAVELRGKELVLVFVEFDVIVAIFSRLLILMQNGLVLVVIHSHIIRVCSHGLPCAIGTCEKMHGIVNNFLRPSD